MKKKKKVATVILGVFIVIVIASNIAIFALVDKKRKVQIEADLGGSHVNYTSHDEKFIVEVYSNNKGDSLFIVKRWEWDLEGPGKYWVKVGEFKKRPGRFVKRSIAYDGDKKERK
jgi:hypothetical protein